MLIIAHRGASGTYPENTVAAFQAAYEMGARAIETDVRKCLCHGKLKLSHDPITAEEECAELADFFEVLQYGEWMDELHLEIKERGLVRDILRVTKHLRYHKNIVYSSFLWRELFKLKLRKPSARIGLLWGGDYKDLPIWIVILLGKILGARSVHIDFSFLCARMAQHFRRHRFLVYAFTLNDPVEIYAAWQMRLDGIFTDYPAYAGEMIAEAQNIVIQ